MELKTLISTFAALLVSGVVYDTVTRKQKSGVKPWLACFLDALYAFPKLFGVGPFKKDALYIKTVIADQMKLHQKFDFGGDEIEVTKRHDPLIDIGLVRSKAQVSPFGASVLIASMSKRMKLRLEMVDYIKKHPKVKSVAMKNPVFVIGFTRTGTTFLHEILGLHPDVRMHYTWEQIEFVPRTDDESMEALVKDRKVRYDANKGEFGLLTSVAGDAIQSIHRIEYDAPEECTSPCGMELPFNIPTIPFMPFAAKEIIDMGAQQAFPLYKQYLQLLAFQTPERQDPFTWMLKCPFHLPYLSELHATFPDATIVWTHRNPVECIASACSLYETLMKISVDSWTIDKEALGLAVMELSLLSLEKAIRSIEKAAKTMRVLHIRYADNIKDPKAVCKKVMDMAELPFSDEYVRRVDEYMAESTRKRKAMKEKKTREAASGKAAEIHTYSLQEYGLSEEIVLAKFDNYIKKFNL